MKRRLVIVSVVMIVLLLLCLVSGVSAARILDSSEAEYLLGGCTAVCQTWNCPGAEQACDGVLCDPLPRPNCGCTQKTESVSRVVQWQGGTKNGGNCDLCCGPRWDCDCVEYPYPSKCATLIDDWCDQGGVACKLPPNCTDAPAGRYGGSYRFCW